MTRSETIKDLEKKRDRVLDLLNECIDSCLDDENRAQKLIDLARKDLSSFLIRIRELNK